MLNYKCNHTKYKFINPCQKDSFTGKNLLTRNYLKYSFIEGN